MIPTPPKTVVLATLELKAALAASTATGTNQSRFGAQIGTGDDRLASGWRQQHCQHPQRRRLAGAVRPEEPEDLTLEDRKVDSGNGLNRAGATCERAAQASGLNRDRSIYHHSPRISLRCRTGAGKEFVETCPRSLV